MKRSRSGQSVIEILIASAVMVAVMGASAAVMSATERMTEQMMRQSQAISAAEEGVQAVISIADRAWAEVPLGTHGLAIQQSSPVMWVFQGSSDVNDGFTRVVTVTEVDSDTRQAVITVTWHPQPGRTATIEEHLLLTDWAFI